MLPLLPALILLLLNGTASTERMVEGGRLPAALAALQQFAEAPQHRSAEDRTRAEGLALASLLSLSADPELGPALARIFALDIVSGLAPSDKPTSGEIERGEPPERPHTLGQPSSGFLVCQRSRDGPFVR